MNNKLRELRGYILSCLGVYATFNYVRNTFLTPVFYDIFSSAKGKAVVVVGPYYSVRGFTKTSCIFTFSGGNTTVAGEVIPDGDNNCMVALFRFPAGLSEKYTYSIIRENMYGSRKLFSGSSAVSPSPANIQKRRLSVTTLFKYETDYLREWIEYHRGQGVEHFYLYENNMVPDEKIAAVLAPYIKEGLVTHILWPYPYGFYNYKLRKLWPNDALAYTQVPQINHCLYKFGGETEWLLSCDVDEYFYSSKYARITDAIEALNGARDISSIRMEGFWFGGTEEEVGRAKKDGVVRTFILSEAAPTSACKCIFETASVQLASVHNSLVQDTREVTVSPEVLRFNHYRALGWKKRLDENFAREVENKGIFSKLHS